MSGNIFRKKTRSFQNYYKFSLHNRAVNLLIESLEKGNYFNGKEKDSFSNFRKRSSIDEINQVIFLLRERKQVYGEDAVVRAARQDIRRALSKITISGRELPGSTTKEVYSRQLRNEIKKIKKCFRNIIISLKSGLSNEIPSISSLIEHSSARLTITSTFLPLAGENETALESGGQQSGVMCLIKTGSKNLKSTADTKALEQKRIRPKTEAECRANTTRALAHRRCSRSQRIKIQARRRARANRRLEYRLRHSVKNFFLTYQQLGTRLNNFLRDWNQFIG